MYYSVLRTCADHYTISTRPYKHFCTLLTIVGIDHKLYTALWKEVCLLVIFLLLEVPRLALKTDKDFKPSFKRVYHLPNSQAYVPRVLDTVLDDANASLCIF